MKAIHGKYSTWPTRENRSVYRNRVCYVCKPRVIIAIFMLKHVGMRDVQRMFEVMKKPFVTYL